MYRISKDKIPEYVINVFKSDCCRGLMPVAVVDAAEDYSISYEESGLRHFCGNTMRSALSDLRLITDAFYRAAEFLVYSGYLSIDGVYFSEEKNIAYLLPQEYDDRSFVVRIAEFCAENGCKRIGDRIIAENDKNCLGIRDLQRLLSTWELEL